jgi:hypothetical protein
MKIWGGSIILGERTVFPILAYFLVLGVWFWSFGEPLQGAPGC